METKPGLYTTEFWSHAIFQVLLFANDFGIWSFVPPKYAVPAQAVAAGLYFLARGWAKSGVTPSPESLAGLPSIGISIRRKQKTP